MAGAQEDPRTGGASTSRFTLRHTLRFDISDFAGIDPDVQQVVFSPDGTLLAAELDQTVLIWNVGSPGKPGSPKVLEHESYGISPIAFSPDGNLIATEDATQKVGEAPVFQVLIWDARSPEVRPQPVARLKEHGDDLHTFAFSPDGRTLASLPWSDDRTVRVWDVATGKLKASLSMEDEFPNNVAFSPDGELLAIVASDQVQVWKFEALELRAGPKLILKDFDVGHDISFGEHLVFSPDGTRLATSGWGTEQSSAVYIWELVTGRLEASVPGDEHAIMQIKFSPDGRTLAFGTGEHLVPGGPSEECRERPGCVESLPDIPSPTSGIRVFHVERTDPPELAFAQTVDAAAVNDLAFSPDGLLLATLADGRISFWDAATGEPRHAFDKDAGEVSAFAFSPDGAVLATGGREVRLWNVGR
jgi:WD40 repeat protein